jgi:hypothetical protein
MQNMAVESVDELVGLAMDQEAFQNRIDDCLKGHVEQLERNRLQAHGVHDILPLLRISVGRVLMKLAVRHGSATQAVMELSPDDARHIYDWLLAARIRDEAWLSRCDAQGRPLKLMKFGSVQQIVAEANKAMAKRRADGSRQDANEGTRVVHDCGGGWTVVRLLTPEALDYETAQMGHCVGQGAYDDLIEEDPIYSLRDPMGRSHITIEVDNYSQEIRQLKGKQNHTPKIDYTRRLIGWSGLVGLTISEGECAPGFGIDKRFGLIELGTLKPGETFEGDLWITFNDSLETRLALPPQIRIKGDVSFRGPLGQTQLLSESKPTTLPEGLTVDGNVQIERMHLDRLSINADVILIDNSHVKTLGCLKTRRLVITDSVFDAEALSSSVINGEVQLRFCTGAEFRETTTVTGAISVIACGDEFSSSPSITFEDGFQLRGRNELSIDGSSVSFGNTIKVDGHFSITNRSMVDMPRCLNVSGNMIVSESRINCWPEMMDIRGLTAETSVQVIDHSCLPLSRPFRSATR